MRYGAPDLEDLLALVGFGLVVYGVSLIYVPAAWIMAGAGSLTFAVLVVRKKPTG